MSQPIHCPKCKGDGTLKLHTGRPSNIIPFAKEHWSWAKDVKPEYKVVDLAEYHIIIECPLCQGSGIVLVVPAQIVGKD